MFYSGSSVPDKYIPSAPSSGSSASGASSAPGSASSTTGSSDASTTTAYPAPPVTVVPFLPQATDGIDASVSAQALMELTNLAPQPYSPFTAQTVISSPEALETLLTAGPLHAIVREYEGPISYKNFAKEFISGAGFIKLIAAILGGFAGYFYIAPAGEAAETVSATLSKIFDLDIAGPVKEIIAVVFQTVGSVENASLTALSSEQIISNNAEKAKQLLAAKGVLELMAQKIEAGLTVTSKDVANAKEYLRYKNASSWKKLFDGFKSVLNIGITAASLAPIPLLSPLSKTYQQILMLCALSANVAPNYMGVSAMNFSGKEETAREIFMRKMQQSLDKFAKLSATRQLEILEQLKPLIQQNKKGKNTKLILAILLNLSAPSAEEKEFLRAEAIKKPAANPVPSGINFSGDDTVAIPDAAQAAKHPIIENLDIWLPEPYKNRKEEIARKILGIMASIGALGYSGDTFLQVLAKSNKAFPNEAGLSYSVASVFTIFSIPAFGGLGYLGGAKTAANLFSDKPLPGAMYYPKLFTAIKTIIWMITLFSGFTNYDVNIETSTALVGLFNGWVAKLIDTIVPNAVNLENLAALDDTFVSQGIEQMYGLLGVFSAGLVNGSFFILMFNILLKYFGDRFSDIATKRRVNFTEQMQQFINSFNYDSMSSAAFRELFEWMLDASKTTTDRIIPEKNSSNTEGSEELGEQAPLLAAIKARSESHDDGVADAEFSPEADESALSEQADKLSRTLLAIFYQELTPQQYQKFEADLNQPRMAIGLPPIECPADVKAATYRDVPPPGCLQSMFALFSPEEPAATQANLGVDGTVAVSVQPIA